MQKNKKCIPWSLLVLGELMVAFLIARYQGLSQAHEPTLNARYLSDGFFIVGLFMTGVGLLTWISTTGFFDMMSYGVQYGVRAFIGLFGSNRKPDNQNFYDYKMAKEEKRGKPGYVILLSGAAMILLSVVFLAIHYNI